MENDISQKTSTMKRLLFLQKKTFRASEHAVLLRHVIKEQFSEPTLTGVPGAEVTAHTEREGKSKTIPFMHFKANIFIACPCIVCLYQKKIAWLFFCLL